MKNVFGFLSILVLLATTQTMASDGMHKIESMETTFVVKNVNPEYCVRAMELFKNKALAVAKRHCLNKHGKKKVVKFNIRNKHCSADRNEQTSKIKVTLVFYEDVQAEYLCG